MFLDIVKTHKYSTIFVVLVSCSQLLTSCASLDAIAEVVGDKAESYNQNAETEKEYAYQEYRRKEERRREKELREEELTNSRNSNQTTALSNLEKAETNDPVREAVDSFRSGCEQWCIPCNVENGFPGIDHDKNSKACY